MTPRFCTIGHSNRSAAEFVDILRTARISLVVDVRSFPKSRSNPQFNLDTLPGLLGEHQIGHLHVPALGGRRKMQPNFPNEVNAAWRNRSFHNYADFALSPEFGTAFDSLVELERSKRLAIMCSEAVWWRCHRRIIADYLLLNGHPVVHLMGNGREEASKATPGAERTPEGKVVYPAPLPAR